MSCNYLGNSSQSIIPVPNFFYTRKLKSLDTFTNNNINTKKHFTEKDLFNKIKELNFSRNYRNNDKVFEEYNTRRLVPKQHREIKKISSSLNTKDLPGKARIPEELFEFEKYNQYMEKMNSQEQTKERIEEMRSNINGVIDRLNSNSIDDLISKKRNDAFSTKNQFTTVNSLNPFDFKTKITYFNAETENEKFQQSIKDKMHNLSKNNFLKTNLFKKSSSYNEYGALIATQGSQSGTKFGFMDKNTKSSEFLPSNLVSDNLKTSLNIKRNLVDTFNFKKDFKMDTMFSSSKGTRSDVRIPFRKRKYDEEMLINTDLYNSREQRRDYKPKKSIIHEPFFS